VLGHKASLATTRKPVATTKLSATKTG